MRKIAIFIVALMVVVALASVATAKDFPNVSGEWEGTIFNASIYGKIKTNLRLTQEGNRLSGRMDTDPYPLGDPRVSGGFVSEKGKVTFMVRGGTAEMTLQLSPDGNALTGEFCISKCSKVELTRQK